MIVYLNGEFVEESRARISMFDRGLWFGDGVYEAVRYFNQHGVFVQPHVDRMKRGLRELAIAGVEVEDFLRIGGELVRRNEWPDAVVYWLVTRGGESGRVHLPVYDVRPTVAAFASPLPGFDETGEEPASSDAVLLPDERWGRCDIKSLNLLANVMAVMEADRLSAKEAILHRGEFITEAASANVIVVRNGVAATPPTGGDDTGAHGHILRGVTRGVLMEKTDVQARHDERFLLEVRPVRRDELRDADEIMITSTTRLVKSIVRLDGQTVGAGTPGPIAKIVQKTLLERIRTELGW
jgi:D-alanine transaminase